MSLANDLFVFEFGGTGEEVLLPPTIVGEIGQHFQNLFNRVADEVARDAAPELFPDPFQMFLAAADRGSLRLAFKSIIRALASDETTRAMGNVKSGVESGTVISAAVGSAIVFAGVQLGFFKHESPTPETPSAIVVEMGERAARSPAVRDNFKRLVEAVERGNVDRVVFRAPDAPSCVVGSSQDMSSTLLGVASKIDTSLIEKGGLRGTVRLTGESFNANVSLTVDHPTQLYAATFETRDLRVPVVVWWRSKRPVPGYKDDYVSITGSFSRFSDAAISPTESVPAWARQAAGLLTVSGMIVEE